MAWIKKLDLHPFALVVVSIALVALAATLAAGAPSELPSIALGSPALLHVERALLLVIAFFFVFVILVYAAKGELPTEVSREGLKYAGVSKETVMEVKGSADPGVALTYRESSDDDDVEDKDSPAPGELLVLRLKLEAKLTYIAKFMLRPKECDCATFVTVGSLNYDGYLTDEEARTASQVLTLREEELDTLSPAARREVLTGANSVVGNIRASVFYGLVRVMLSRNRWEVEAIPAVDRRPDLLVRQGSRCVRIAPRFVLAEDQGRVRRVVRRLEKVQGEKDAEGELSIVVLPDRTRNETAPGVEPVATVVLSELQAMLELTQDPRSLQ